MLKRAILWLSMVTLVGCASSNGTTDTEAGPQGPQAARQKVVQPARAVPQWAVRAALTSSLPVALGPRQEPRAAAVVAPARNRGQQRWRQRWLWRFRGLERWDGRCGGGRRRWEWSGAGGQPAQAARAARSLERAARRT